MLADACIHADHHTAPFARGKLNHLRAHPVAFFHPVRNVDFGAMAAVVLMTALKSLGAQTEVHIPHRVKEGYGMRSQVIELAAREGCRVVISVDTGIREHEVLARARALGMDCIVTDHHLPAASLPEACAILNPRR